MKNISLKYILASTMLVLSLAVFAQDNVDIIVTNDGESMKVYNLDYSPCDFCYYTTESNSEDLKRIRKSEVLIIKLANGTKVDPSNIKDLSKHTLKLGATQENPRKYSSVTHQALSCKEDILDVFSSDGQELTMRIISETDKTLAVTKPRKGLSYNLSSYTIPDQVEWDGKIYTVTCIDKKAFHKAASFQYDKKIKQIELPKTLIRIEDQAFFGNANLYEIILPDGVEYIGKEAFMWCGFYNQTFKELYIPKTVQHIGSWAFRGIGSNRSFREFFQGYLSSIPDFITIGNCTSYGIDEEAVEAYMSRNK